ncbi:MAG: rhombosortase [Woeseiaceae bacterium]|nr:rhombosortase [Woeseiaceae bacterium]
MIGVSAAIALWGEVGREWLRYDRAAIADGEVWRLVTGHLVHLGPAHFLMNAAGLGLVWFLFAREFDARGWLAILFAVVAGISAGFWFLDPELAWYVGLSGLLHGMLAAGIVAGLPGRRREAVILAVLVAAKLVWEQLAGPLPGSEETAGGNVIVNAHLYGTLAGAVAGAIMRRLGQQKK